MFGIWLRNAISIAAHISDELSEDVIEVSQILEVNAIAYRHMYARGMHFQIRGIGEEKVTCAVTTAVWKK
jgi:hypothetical protein